LILVMLFPIAMGLLGAPIFSIKRQPISSRMKSCLPGELTRPNHERAFNALGSGGLAAAHRAGEPLGVPIAGDDQKASALATTLIRAIGFEPVRVGGLAMGQYLVPGTPLRSRRDATLTSSSRKSSLAQPVIRSGELSWQTRSRANQRA